MSINVVSGSRHGKTAHYLLIHNANIHSRKYCTVYDNYFSLIMNDLIMNDWLHK